MKKDIHPTYYPEAKVTCACGATFTMGSTEKEIRIEICSACHPYFTGKEKLVDTAGRVDKFKERMEAAKKFKETKELKNGKTEEKKDKTEKAKESADEKKEDK